MPIRRRPLLQANYCNRESQGARHCKPSSPCVGVDISRLQYRAYKNASNPYSKMEMGIPFTRRPSALRIDYKVHIPEGVSRVRATGSSRKDIPGRTMPRSTSCFSDAGRMPTATYMPRGWEPPRALRYINRLDSQSRHKGALRRHIFTSRL